MKNRKFQMALLSIITFGFLIILILNLGVASNTCTNLDKLIAQHEEQEAEIKASECKSKNNSTFPWQKFRLPGESIPTKYFLFIYPNPEEGSFSGLASITFKSNTKGKYIALHGRGLTIRSLSIDACWENDPDCHSDLDSQDSQAEVEDYFESCNELGMLVIKMKNDLHMGKMYKLSIKYSKKLDDNPTKGIYMQKYTIGGILSHYIVTNFAPMGARDVFPSFDEPNYPAKFKFQVVRSKSEKVFFNENFDQKAPFGKSSASSDEFGLSKSIDSHEVDNFETFREFSTFQLGFVIGKFITNSNVIKNLKNGDFSIRLSYIEGSISDISLNKTLETMSKLIRKAEEYIGDLKKLRFPRFVLLPNYPNDEYLLQPTGLIFLSLETVISMNELHAKFTIAQAISQQIFQVCQENFWWDHLWQESGIVNLIAMNLLEKPEQDLYTIKMRHEIFHYEKFVSLRDIVPLTEVEVKNTVALSHSMKWWFVLDMFKEYLDQIDHEVFSKSLRKTTFENSIFESPDVMSLNDQGIDMISIVADWTLNDLPYIQIQTMGGEVVFRQFSSSSNDVPFWSVPILYSVDDGTDRMFLLNKNDTQIQLNTIPQMILANKNGHSAYRLLYSSQLMTYMISAIEVAHDLAKRDEFMSPMARAIFYQDLFHFAKVGKIDYQKIFRYSASLHEEKNPVIWKSAIDGFNWLDSQLGQSFDSRESDWFHKFMIGKLSSAYSALNGDIQDKNFENIIKTTACHFGVEECVQDQLKKFESFKTTPTNDHLVPCVAVRNGRFDEVFRIFNSTTNFLLAQELAHSLTCTNELDKIKEILLRSITTKQHLRPYFQEVMMKISASKYGHILVFEFIENNWLDFISKIPYLSHNFQRIFFNLADLMPSSKMLLNILANHIETREERGEAYKNFASQIEHISNEKNTWNIEYKTEFICWLRQFYHKTPGSQCTNI